MQIKKITTLAIVSCLILSYSCKRKGCTDANASNYDSKAKKDDGSCEFNSVGSYDRAKMLSDMTDKYIVPAYEGYSLATSELKNKVETFNSSPTITTLQELKKSWKKTCINWQRISFIDFGPAKDISLKSQSNIYPVDTNLVNSNISSGNYNLQLPSNFDSKGLQAIDYMLFGKSSTEQETVTYFTNTNNAKTYLADITNEINQNAISVLNNWKNTYANSFKNNNSDNSQGSSVSTMVNALSEHYEAFIRKGKIGLPAGVFNGFSKQPMPGHVEALYSTYSIEYAVEAVNYFGRFINGNGYSTNEQGQGLDDYIKFVGAKTSDNTPLETVINNQISTIINSLNSHTNPLSDEVTNNNSAVLSTYQEMQKLVPLIKVDLTSALGVLVTYQDNDGD